MEITSSIIEYTVKSGVAFTALYLLYCAVFSKLQNFIANRFYLLFNLLFALLFPFIEFSRYVEVAVPAAIPNAEVAKLAGNAVANDLPQINVPSIITYVYLTIAAIMLVRMLFMLVNFILRLVHNSKNEVINGRRVYVSDYWKQTFSFFRIIVFSKSDVVNSSSCRVLLNHELAHVKQFHTIDILLAELFQIIQWFNPLAYRLKKDLSEVHEYLADSYVVSNGENALEYQQTLLNYVESSMVPQVVNLFSAKLLKKRFIMMTLDSKPQKMFKYLLAAPVVTVLVLTMSCNTQEMPVETTVEQLETTVEQQQVADTSSADVLEYDADAFVVVEELPKFQGGGISDFRDYVMGKIVYPQEAIDKKITGNVYVNFVVDKYGNVTKSKIIRGVDPLLDNEVTRVFSNLPTWTPGKQRGVNVDVQFTIPVKFVL